MGLLLILSKITYRKNDIWNSIAISIMCLLIYNQYMISNISTLLSYGGLIGIIVLNNSVEKLFDKLKIRNKRYKYIVKYRQRKIIEYIKETIAVSISVQLMIMPLLIVYFNKISFAFFISCIFLNLLLIPIMIIGILMIFLSFISINLAKLFSYILILLLKILILLSEFTNCIANNRYIATPSIFEVLIYYFILFSSKFLFSIYNKKNPSSFEFRIRNMISLIKYKIKKKLKIIICILLLISLLLSVWKVTPKNLKIYFIDVGQR